MGSKELWSGLLDLVYPTRCAGCDALDPHAFCGACRKELEPVRDIVCQRCGQPRVDWETPAGHCAACRHPRAFDQLRGAYVYSGPLRQAIGALKFRRRIAAARALAELLAEAVARADADDLSLADLPLASIDLVCPVPLYPKRQRARGFNQATLLAEPLARALGVPSDPGLIKRIRDTRPQPGLSGDDRERNVAGAFSVVEGQHPIRGRHILIIDDVVTTGATASQCAAVLRQVGAAGVWVLALARAARPTEGMPPSA
jgi:ComF family protein